jgi:hypothetical protein
MILTQYFLGVIEDNVGFFSFAHSIGSLTGCTDYIAYPTGLCQNLLANNQPFTAIPTYLLSGSMNRILSYNILILVSLLLNFTLAFRFFKRFWGRFIASLLTITLLFSPYLAYQSRAHVDLLQSWPVIWFLDTLFFSKSRYKAVFLGLLLTLVTGMSNYLGYFTVIFAGLYSLIVGAQLILKKASIVKGTRLVVTTAVVFVLASSLFIAPYIKSNYFSPVVRMEETIDTKAVNRPFADFVAFSSRPWYYVLPSVDNPFFGRLSQSILNRLSSGGNYLAQNYFKAEHSASYLGWVNLSLAAAGVISLLRHRSSPQIKEGTRLNYPALLITGGILILLTMPPSVVMTGTTIYLPSYILFKFFPMFRVLARAGILILFLTLIFTGYGYLALVKLMISKKINRRVVQSILLIVALISAAEFIIPLKITHVGTPPKVYAYIGTTDRLKSPVAVYPYNKTNEALFWMDAHKQPLINPRYYVDKATGFESEDFTKLLNTPLGLEKAHSMGAKYLVYFYQNDGKNDDKANIEFFDNSLLLSRVDTFEETSPNELNYTFIRIVEAGSSKSNSAILYKFK